MSITHTIKIIITFLSYSVLHSSPCPIMFVHLGGEIPSCTFTTMKQARYLNEESDLYLLTDSQNYNYLQGKRCQFFIDERIDLIDVTRIPLTTEHENFCKVNQMNPDLLEGFWIYTLERFFFLFDFIKDRQIEYVLHLENDTMVYLDIEELLPIFFQMNARIAAPFQSLHGCIPCFVFIKDGDSLALLLDHIILEMANYKGNCPEIAVNDMQLLASFYRKFGVEYMTPLPTLMNEYRHYYKKKKSMFLADNRTRLEFLSMCEELFDGYIFDAAGLGIYLNGNDRKYAPMHGPGTIHSRCLFYPSLFSFFWGRDKKGKIVPYCSFKGKDYRIANMHFHSKMPERYTSFGMDREELPKALGRVIN